uniref:Copper ion binding protein n=1 Tax=Phaseolus vulgaris TaxID=3885 RepID=V7ANE0_PHAVU|nr:hypothetical protein PHAVU_010G108400g [Phaseolus vulgaris]ESW07182.1 hypothetical protein PHAVU_010G108400g [Phaseolus vulgaris]
MLGQPIEKLFWAGPFKFSFLGGPLSSHHTPLALPCPTSPNPFLSGYHLIQRCSVSGTAKGKAKIKAGQALKRSRITIKKSGSASQIREREAEREKMGLIGKERQREIDMMRKKNNKIKVSEKPTIIGTPGLDYISLGLVDEEKLPKYELTVEDGRRLAKEYSRVLMRKHRARQAAESNLLKMKKEAIEALPEGLREAALVPDLSPFPVNRFMATLTPPIEGYIEQVREAANKISGMEKIR